MKARPARLYIGMYFRCCQVYTRIYLNRAGTAYVGWCPKCLGKVTVKVTPGGSRARFWEAG